MLRARERAPTPYSSVVFYLDSHFSPSRQILLLQEYEFTIDDQIGKKYGNVDTLL